MLRAPGDVCALVFIEQEFLLALCYAGGSPHHDPVFRPVVMHLERKTGAWIYGYTLYLEAITGIDGLVRPPRTVGPGMRKSFLSHLLFESADNELNILGPFDRRNQHRVLCLDDYLVFNA